MSSELLPGGRIVKLENGDLACEGVPGAYGGLVVHSAHHWRDGEQRKRSSYVVGCQVTKGSAVRYLYAAPDVIVQVLE